MGLNIYLWFLIFASFGVCQFPKIVWTYWATGSNSHVMIKMFNQNHRKKIQHDGWEVRLLNKTSVIPYVEQIPSVSKQQLSRVLKEFPAQKQSDYFRCVLISYYGGVYLDLTSIIYEDFSWLKFQNLKKNPDMVNRYGDEPDVLFFSNYVYGSKQTHFDVSLNQTFEVSPGYEIWFIAAKPQTPFMKQYCYDMIQSYLDGSFLIDRYKKTVLKTLQQQKIETGHIKNSEYLVSINVMQIMIQRKQRQLDKLSKQNKSARQLVVRKYKIWHIHGERGPIQIFFYVGNDYLKFLATYSLEQIRTIFHITSFKYFLKIPHDIKAFFMSYFVTETPFYQILQRLKCFYEQSIYCTIYKGSFLYEYFIKDSLYQDRFHIVDANIQNRSPPRIFNTSRFEITILILLILIVGLTSWILILLKKQRKLNMNQASIRINTWQNENEKEIDKK